MKEKAPEEEQSERNSAALTIHRIHKVKVGLISATVTNDIEEQWKWLKAYFKELVAIFDDKDDEAQKKRFKEARVAYNMYLEAKRQGKKSIPLSVIDNIDDWEIELKNLEQKYGMSMPKKADPRYAMAGR